MYFHCQQTYLGASEFWMPASMPSNGMLISGAIHVFVGKGARFGRKPQTGHHPGHNTRTPANCSSSGVHLRVQHRYWSSRDGLQAGWELREGVRSQTPSSPSATCCTAGCLTSPIRGGCDCKFMSPAAASLTPLPPGILSFAPIEPTAPSLPAQPGI